MGSSFKEIDIYIQKLKSTKSKIRKEAIEALVKMGNIAALPPITNLKNDPNKEVRYLVAKTLGIFKNPVSKKTLLDMLKDDSEKVRYRTIISLGKYELTEFIPIFIKYLDDPDENVRYFSRKSLVKFGKKSIFELIGCLSSDKWIVRKEASLALGEIGEEAIEDLIEKSSSNNKNLRYWVTKAIGNIKSIKVTTILIKMTVDKVEEIKIAAIEGLGNSEDSKAIPPLIQLLETDNNIIRFHVKEALIKIGDNSLTQVVKSLHSKKWHTRKAAAEILGTIGGEAVELLLTELESDDSDTIFWALEAIGMIKDHACTYQVAKFLTSDNRDLVLSSIKTLGKMKDDRILSNLVELLEKSDEELIEELSTSISKFEKKAMIYLIENLSHEKWIVRKNSAKTLKKMGDLVLKPMIEILGAPDEDTAYWAAEILGDIGQSAENRLINFLDDSNSAIRFHAVRTLGKLKSEKAGESFLTLLYDEYWSIRKEAAKSLGIIKYKRAVDSLINVLEDEDEDLRAIVCNSLGEIGESKAVPFLKPLLNDSFSEVRISAIRAISKLGGKKLIRFIIDKVEDENINVRREAIIALGKFSDDIGVPYIIKSLNESELRIDAIEALGNMNSSKAESQLINIVNNSKNNRERAVAILSLSNYKSSRVMDCLTKSLLDRYWLIRMNSATSLSIISEKKNYNDSENKKLTNKQKEVMEKYKLGISFLKGKKYSEAILAFQRVLRIDSSHYYSIIKLGIVYEKMGMLKESVKQFENAISLKSDRPEGYLYMGILLGIRKKYKESLKYLEKSLVLAKKNSTKNVELLANKLIKNMKSKI